MNAVLSMWKSGKPGRLVVSNAGINHNDLAVDNEHPALYDHFPGIFGIYPIGKQPMCVTRDQLVAGIEHRERKARRQFFDAVNLCFADREAV